MGDFADHKVPEMECPGCGEINDGALAVDTEHSEPPSPGDISVCAYCAMVSIYETDRLRPITDQEFQDAVRDYPLLLQALGAVRTRIIMGS